MVPPLLHTVRRHARRATLALLPLVAACGDVAEWLAPGRDAAAPAQVAVRASIAANVAQAGDVVTLRVRSSYVRRGGERVAIGAQVLTLSTAAVQAVPVPVDVGSCLSDAARDAAGSADCPVVLELALLVNGTVVDEQVIGPLTLAPGATTTVDDPVTLYEIASLTVTRAGGAPLGDQPVVVEGATLALGAQVRDTRGQPVTGRPTTWRSSDATRATVDAQGVVRGIAPGVVRIVATSGPASGEVALRVARAPQALTVAAGRGRGTVRSEPAGIDCTIADGTATGTCRATFDGDATVALVAEAAGDSRFDGWEAAGCAAIEGTRCRVTMDGPRTATARFRAQRLVRVVPIGDGHGVVRSEPAGLRCTLSGGTTSGECALRVDEGATVRLVAEPDAASPGDVAQVLGGWGEACAGASGTGCTLVAGGTDLEAGVRFLGGRTLTVRLDGTAGGRIEGPGGIDCTPVGGRCTARFAHGTVVTLHATPVPDAQLESWTGCPAVSSQLDCTVTLTAPVTVAPQFGLRPEPLALRLIGPGAGTVRVNGAVACTRAAGDPTVECTVNVPRGTAATVTAAAEAGSRLLALGGACAAEGPCQLGMTGPRSVSVTFARELVPLTLVLGGVGAGEVRVDGVGACTRSTNSTGSVTCTRMVELGRPVSLLAVAAPGSTFDGFEAPCGTAAPCTITLQGARTIGGRFGALPIVVRVVGQPGATGSGQLVGVSPTALDCRSTAGVIGGPLCAVSAPVGTAVAIRAQPEAGSVFAGWDGACAGTIDATCRLVLSTMTPTTLTPRFAAATPMDLAVAFGGSARLEVAGLPAFAPCDGPQFGTPRHCRYELPRNASVRVVAQPRAGFVVDGFVGDACVRQGNACTLMLGAARRVEVRFAPAP